MTHAEEIEAAFLAGARFGVDESSCFETDSSLVYEEDWSRVRGAGRRTATAAAVFTPAAVAAAALYTAERLWPLQPSEQS